MNALMSKLVEIAESTPTGKQKEAAEKAYRLWRGWVPARSGNVHYVAEYMSEMAMWATQALGASAETRDLLRDFFREEARPFITTAKMGKFLCQNVGLIPEPETPPPPTQSYTAEATKRFNEAVRQQDHTQIRWELNALLNLVLNADGYRQLSLANLFTMVPVRPLETQIEKEVNREISATLRAIMAYADADPDSSPMLPLLNTLRNLARKQRDLEYQTGRVD